LDRVVRSEVGAGNAGRRLKDNRNTGDRPILGIDNLNDERLVQRLTHNTGLSIAADDRNFGWLSGAWEEQSIATAGSGSEDDRGEKRRQQPRARVSRRGLRHHDGR
jgi:hypothetical protein